jgi:hypothetical protein
MRVLGDSFKNLQLRVFERHDLVLAKLPRNSDRDRADVESIAAGPGLDVETLRRRYESELRYKLGRSEREDLTRSCGLRASKRPHSAADTDLASPSGCVSDMALACESQLES